MTEDNVMEFCQWLVSEKGIEAGNLSDYINNNEEEVLKLAEEFKKPKFKVGGKVEAAAEMFKCGGKTKKVEKKQGGGETPNHTIYDLKTGKVSKKVDGIGSKETYVDGPSRRTLEVFNGDSTIVAKDPNWPESRSRSYEDIMTFMRKKDIGFDTNLRSFNGMKEIFQRKYPNIKSMAGGGDTDGIKKTNINYGPDFKEFEDHTGRYTRIIPNKQDTIWVFNDWGANREVRTSPYGYIGRLNDIYGNNRQLSPEESAIVRQAVDSRANNIPYNKSLREKYRHETFLPENWEKVNSKQTGGIVKAQDGEKVYNPGEIRADDRTKLGRWWDKVKTNYRNSNWANSGPGMVMNIFTPLGAIDSASNNDYIGALMSLLPLGMADDVGRALKYDDLAKMFPLKFDEVKRLNNFNVSNGRIVASRKGPMTAEKAKELYESSPEIQKLVDQGFNVNSKGHIVTPDASTFSTVDEYINAARQRAKVLKHRSYQDSWKTTRNNIGESQELLYESLGPQGYREVVDAAKTSGNKAKRASGYIHPGKLMK